MKYKKALEICENDAVMAAYVEVMCQIDQHTKQLLGEVYKKQNTNAFDKNFASEVYDKLFYSGADETKQKQSQIYAERFTNRVFDALQKVIDKDEAMFLALQEPFDSNHYILYTRLEDYFRNKSGERNDAFVRGYGFDPEDDEVCKMLFSGLKSVCATHRDAGLVMD